MIKDLTIIPNFFDNPDEILTLARAHTFYSNTEHPKDKNTSIYYGGKRTEELSGTKEKTILIETFLKKVIHENIPNDAQVNFEFYGSSYFHYFDNQYSGGTSELHQDSSLMAGVIYLNPCHLDNPENHGTIIFNKNRDSFTVPYVYNTMIFYRSDYVHAPLAGFGDSLESSRLSMIFNLGKFKLDLSRNTL